MKRQVAVVVVSYNTTALLEKCLSALRGVAAAVPLEVVVVDNASGDGSPEMVRRCFPEVQVIANDENRGFAYANNQGIRASQSEYVLLLNSDAFLDEAALAALIGVMESRPGCGICGPVLLNRDGSWQGGYGALLSPSYAMWSAFGFVPRRVALHRLGWKLGLERYFSEPFGVPFIAGTCMMLRRSMLDAIGLLDERFFMYSEDSELCARAAREGWEVVCAPSARVVHYLGESTTQSNPQRGLEMRTASHELYITELYGAGGWRRFVRWKVVGYRIRYLASSLAALFGLGSRKRNHLYRLAAEAYLRR